MVRSEKELGTRIVMACKQRNITQGQPAGALGMIQQTSAYCKAGRHMQCIRALPKTQQKLVLQMTEMASAQASTQTPAR